MSQIIDLHSSALRLRILSRGATLSAVRFADSPRNLVLGFADPSDHIHTPGFAGHLAGPVANRLRGGLVEIDGTRHQMPLNEAGRTTLHSGPEGLHAQDWEVTSQGADAVTLTCRLADGQGGLPGNRTFTAHYALSGATLQLTLTAHTDRTTPINIAAHPYWNLDGEADVSGHQLRVASQSYLPVDAHNLPLGQPAPVAQTIFDFTKAQPVPLTPALDVNFCLSDHMRTTPQHAATLVGRNGTTLRIATTCPGLQVYNGAFLPDLPVAMADAPALAPYAGIALEPQHWPDAMHHSHFPEILLRPGDTYGQISTFELTA